MSVKEQLTLAAGLAVALATSALFPLFQGGSWFLRVLGAVLVVTVTGLLTRRLGVPGWLQPLAAVVALALYLSLVFAGGTLGYGLVPTGRTVDALRALVEAGRLDVSRYAPPVPPSKGLVLLAAGGVGAIAVLVDAVAVVLDRAPAAGLPLLALLAVPSAVLPGGLGGVPFVLGAIGWLGLLLVEGSERVGRWGSPMRSSLPGARPGGDDSSLGRVGRRIGFAALGMAVVLPGLVPGLDHRLVGGGAGGDGDGGGASSATTYNPITRLDDQLRLPHPRQLFVYETTDPDPDYIRMTTLDQYSGSGWSSSKLEADRDGARVQDGIAAPTGDGGPHRDLTMKIAVDGDHLDVYWLPVPFGPTKVAVKGTWLWDPASQTVFSAARTTRNLPPYTVTASRVLPDRAALAAVSGRDVDAKVAREYGQPLEVPPYVQRLTARVVAGKGSEYEKAVALQDFFSPQNGFVYDLTASRAARGQDPLEAFLRGRHGFCEQYATAMAVMLRVAGIPSRVAVGFTPGSKVKAKGKTYYSVTTEQAHAWPEAWFAGTGWVRFEPTPAASGATVPDYTLQTVPTGPTAEPTAPAPTATPGGPKPKDPEQLLDKGNKTGADPAAAARAQQQGRSPLWLLAPVAAAALLALPFALTQVRRRGRRRRSGPLTAWAQLVDDATDVGHVWQAADSPRAAAARLQADRSLPGPAAAALERTALAAERARYAPPGREDPGSRGAAGGGLADVAVVRSALQAGSPRAVRLRALLFPPSTLRWASTELGARVGDALERVDDAISAVTRPLRRRAAPH